MCDGDQCRSTELRIGVTIYQRKAGEIRAYEHLYCERHDKLVAVWRNVPIGSSTPARAATPRRHSLNESAGSEPRCAILEHVLDECLQADRILIVHLHGEAKHQAKWRELTEDEEAVAVAALRELPAGRGDLLAHVAGILEGSSEGELGEPLARQAAGLCRTAGADPEAIAAWVQEGRRRSAAVRQPPFPGGLHGGGVQGLSQKACRVGHPLRFVDDFHFPGAL